MSSRSPTPTGPPGPAGPIPEATALVRALRRRWTLRLLARAALLGLGTAAALLALLILLDHGLSGFPSGSGRTLRFVPPGAGLLALVFILRRLVPGPSGRELALEAEARNPHLDHVLVTALSPARDGAMGAVFAARARSALRSLRPAALLPLDLGPFARWAAGVGTLALVLLFTFPGGPGALWARWSDPTPGDPGRRGAAAGGGSGAARDLLRPLAEGLGVRVTPPAYTGLDPWEGSAGEPLSVLPGSRVDVSGSGAAPGAVVVGGEALTVDPDGAGWAVVWRVGVEHRGLLLQRRAAPGVEPEDHLLALDLQEDQPPRVDLHEPASDLVVAAPDGRLPIRASAMDDHGVGELRLTWLRTRGGGESFAFDEGEVAWDDLDRSGPGVRGSVDLPLSALDLRPGDVVHLRAVALDRNDVTGPGEGVSPTRILRVALPEEAHLVTSLVGLPLEAERDPVLSQRMILLLTEELVAEMDRGLPGDSVLRRSTEIAVEQRRLRDQVGEQVYVRATGAMQDPSLHLGYQEVEHDPAAARMDEGFRALPPSLLPDTVNQILQERERRELAEHGGIPQDPTVTGGRSGRAVLPDDGPQGHAHDASPILSVNQDLLRVHDWMWDAERFLLQGEVRESIPSQELALAELQRLREAERVFARGRTTVVPVDVEGVRGTGRADGVEPGGRDRGEPVPSSGARAGTLEALAAGLTERDPAEAARTLSTLGVALLGEAGIPPLVPTLLTRAAAEVRAGRGEEARHLVLQARSALAPPGSAGSGDSLRLPSTPLEGRYLDRVYRGGGS